MGSGENPRPQDGPESSALRMEAQELSEHSQMKLSRVAVFIILVILIISQAAGRGGKALR